MPPEAIGKTGRKSVGLVWGEAVCDGTLILEGSLGMKQVERRLGSLKQVVVEGCSIVSERVQKCLRQASLLHRSRHCLKLKEEPSKSPMESLPLNPRGWQPRGKEGRLSLRLPGKCLMSCPSPGLKPASEDPGSSAQVVKSLREDTLALFPEKGSSWGRAQSSR